MRRPAIVRRVPSAPTDEDFFIRLTIDALMGLIADLRCRVEQTGTRHQVAQVLLAQAHIDEATGLLRAIQPTLSVATLAGECSKRDAIVSRSCFDRPSTERLKLSRQRRMISPGGIEWSSVTN
jgi:hypothetical protein